MEEWKQVKGYETIYEVSNYGKVKRIAGFVYNPRSKTKTSPIKETILQPAADRGYLKVALCKDSKLKTYKVHKLVWEAFNDKVKRGFEIDHINSNKSDNRLSNLQLLSHRDNITKHYEAKPTSSEYTGVIYDKGRGKWRAEISINGRSKYLGRFDNEIEAAESYNRAKYGIATI